MRLLAATGDFNALAVGVFACVLALTLVITRWAAKRTHSATEFYAAGRGVSGRANGIATAGDYLSASTFLGYAGLMYLYGFDGWVIGLGACLSFLPVLYLLAERMRNAGKFTVADVLAFRLKARPVRVATAINTLLISGIYLVAQLVGAGAVIEALAGISFPVAVLICGVFMVVYVVFGGMLATTWVQIIKAVMLMVAGTVVAVAVLAKFNFNPAQLLDTAADNHPDGNAITGPGTYLTSPLLVISTGLTIFIGTAGLPHILTRFFTVPDSNAARKSVLCTIGIIATFTAMVTIIGFGARALLGQGATEAVGKGGNLAAPLLAQFLGGGEGTTGGDIALALFSAAAFATILAVVAGLVIASAGAIAHDLWKNVLGRGSEATERKVARIASIGVGVAAILGTMAIGSGFNVTVLVSMAFVFAASANFPPLLLALFWRRFNTTGALTGIAFGITASVIMIVLSPPVWPGPDSEGSPSPLTFPGLVTIPIGFLGCWLGTMLSKEEVGTERSYDELLVRSETGIGSEGGPEPTHTRFAPLRAHRGARRGALAAVARRAASSAPPCAPPRSPSSASMIGGGSSRTNRWGAIASRMRSTHGSPSRMPRPPPITTASGSSRLTAHATPAPSASTASSSRSMAMWSSRASARSQMPEDSRSRPRSSMILNSDGLLALVDALARAGLHRAAAGVGLHAAAAAARALGAVEADDHVADLARGLAAHPRLAVEDQAAADARAPEDAEQARVLAGGADLELGVGGEVDVVAERDRRAAELLLERLAQVERARPLGEVHGAGDGALVVVHAAGRADADAGEVGDAQARLLQRLLEHGGHARRDRLRAALERRLVAFRAEHLVVSPSSTTAAWIFVPPRSMPP